MVQGVELKPERKLEMAVVGDVARALFTFNFEQASPSSPDQDLRSPIPTENYFFVPLICRPQTICFANEKPYTPVSRVVGSTNTLYGSYEHQMAACCRVVSYLRVGLGIDRTMLRPLQPISRLGIRFLHVKNV